MTRRLLALCSGLSVGYIVGWLAGSNVARMAEGRRLGRERRAAEEYWATVGRRPLPEVIQRAMSARVTPRTAPGHTETPEPLNGRENGEERIPTQRDDEPARYFIPLEDVAAEFGIDLDACDVRSPGGGLVCICRGRHRSHTFQGTSAPDRKDDTDEGIE